MNAIDTSVLIHFYDERDERRRALAKDLIKSLRDGVLLWQVACEFMAASRKSTGLGFTPEKAWEALSDLMSFLPLVLPSHSVLTRARLLMRERQFQFWDALIFAACLENGINRLYSADLPGAAVPGLEIVNPFA